MLGEDDLSSRFDYLFEPLDDDGLIDGTADAPSADRSGDESPARSTTHVRMAFAVFVLATLTAAAVVALLLLPRPNGPEDPVDATLDPTPLSTAVSPDAPALRPVPPPVTTASEVPNPTPQTVESGPAQSPAQPQPTTSNREPQPRVTNSPSTRAPISVAPETRQPFPNQDPRGANGNGGGGLLGGLL